MFKTYYNIPADVTERP